MFKKSSFFFALALGLSSAFAATMFPSQHVENITFNLADGLTDCHQAAPAPVTIEVSRPSKTLKHLTLPKDSPYISIAPGACNNMRPGNVRTFEDTLMSKEGRRIIVMKGTYDSEHHTVTGEWLDNFNCKGSLNGTTR